MNWTFDKNFRQLFLVCITLSSIALAGLGLGGCTSDPNHAEVPSQPFSNALSALGSSTGDLTGRILFPSEFSQHSIRFSVGVLTFVTHPDGRFLITRIPTGHHMLQVNMKGYRPLAIPVKLSDGEVLNLSSISLVQTRGIVRGRLVTPNGKNADGIRLQLDPNGGVNVSDNLGNFQFVGVGAGQYFLRISDPRFSGVVKKVTLREDEKHNLGLITVFQNSGQDRRTAQLGTQ